MNKITKWIWLLLIMLSAAYLSILYSSNESITLTYIECAGKPTSRGILICVRNESANFDRNMTFEVFADGVPEGSLNFLEETKREVTFLRKIKRRGFVDFRRILQTAGLDPDSEDNHLRLKESVIKDVPVSFRDELQVFSFTSKDGVEVVGKLLNQI